MEKSPCRTGDAKPNNVHGKTVIITDTCVHYQDGPCAKAYLLPVSDFFFFFYCLWSCDFRLCIKLHKGIVVPMLYSLMCAVLKFIAMYIFYMKS